MWVHLLIIFTLLILGIILTLSNKKVLKIIFLVLTFCILFILSAFRSANIGNDTYEYLQMYNKFGQALNIFEIDTDIEMGFVIINKILYSINPSSIFLLIVTSALILSVMLIFIYKNSNMVWLSVFLFINFRIYYFTLSGIRQSIALAIVLVSYKFLTEKKAIPFVITVLLASTFHMSAILFLIVYPISNIKYTKRVLAQYMVIGIFLLSLFNVFITLVFRFFPKYRVYLTSSYFESIKIASIVEFLIIFIVLIFGLVVSYKNNNLLNLGSRLEFLKSNIMFHIITLAVVINLVSINAGVIQRAALYFFIFVIIFVPKVIAEIKNKELRVLTTYIIIILTFTYNITILMYRPEWQYVYPYEFFWQIK